MTWLPYLTLTLALIFAWMVLTLLGSLAPWLREEKPGVVEEDMTSRFDLSGLFPPPP